MSSSENLADLRKSTSKEKDQEQIDAKKIRESTKSLKSKNSSPPKENKNKVPFIPERELQIDFSLSFKEIYNLHMTEIEKKTNLKRKHIYYFLIISLFFFLIGHFEIIFSYIITGYFPIKWTIQDYKANTENFGKKWGTYWTFFACFLFFDLHQKEVLKLIPFYFIIKCIFLIILYLPGFNAAANIYDGFLKDYLYQIITKFQNKDENDTMVNELKKIGKLKNE